GKEHYAPPENLPPTARQKAPKQRRNWSKECPNGEGHQAPAISNFSKFWTNSGTTCCALLKCDSRPGRERRASMNGCCGHSWRDFWANQMGMNHERTKRRRQRLPIRGKERRRHLLQRHPRHVPAPVRSHQAARA